MSHPDDSPPDLRQILHELEAQVPVQLTGEEFGRLHVRQWGRPYHLSVGRTWKTDFGADLSPFDRMNQSWRPRSPSRDLVLDELPLRADWWMAEAVQDEEPGYIRVRWRRIEMTEDRTWR